MEDILYLSKKPLSQPDIISVGKEFNYSWKVFRHATVDTVRIIPFQDTYWDFIDYQRTPDFECLEAEDLVAIHRYGPGSIFIVTHRYDTRTALVTFLRKLIDQNGGGIITDGKFDDIDSLTNLDEYKKRHC